MTSSIIIGLILMSCITGDVHWCNFVLNRWEWKTGWTESNHHKCLL